MPWRASAALFGRFRRRRLIPFLKQVSYWTYKPVPAGFNRFFSQELESEAVPVVEVRFRGLMFERILSPRVAEFEPRVVTLQSVVVKIDLVVSSTWPSRVATSGLISTGEASGMEWALSLAVMNFTASRSAIFSPPLLVDMSS